MSIYTVYVETSHGNVRVYEVAALSLDAAMREASQYGRVEYAVRTRGIQVGSSIVNSNHAN